MKKIKFLSLLLVMVVLLASLTACGSQNSRQQAPGSQQKIVRMGDLFANTYTSLDAMKESYGWYTSALGLSQTLFRIDDGYSVIPWLAESASVKDATWTIKLRDDVVFSDGSKLTADIAAACIQRAPQVNQLAVALAGVTCEAADETTFTITTPEYLPTMLNELCNVYTAMINLKASADIDNAPICTGPFKVADFKPGVSVKLVRNDNYWGGPVQLDGVEGIYVADADTLSLAFQNGEIDTYIGPTTNDLEIFAAAPDKYTVVSTPASRLYYYYLNMKRLPDHDLRAAINMAIDSDAICTLLAGLAGPTIGAYGADTPYGKVTKHGYDAQKARSLIEGLGYKLNADSYYAKDGREIKLDIAYYAARSIDQIVLLMQEQLKDVGIKATLSVSEDPDGTYLTTGDFDIGVYCMIANPSADPYYFMNRVVGGGIYTTGGYNNARAQELLAQLYSEPDASRRAQLAVQMQQLILDDEAMGFMALLNKITVMHAGVANCNENNPISFYFLNEKTNIIE